MGYGKYGLMTFPIFTCSKDDHAIGIVKWNIVKMLLIGKGLQEIVCDRKQYPTEAFSITACLPHEHSHLRWVLQESGDYFILESVYF